MDIEVSLILQIALGIVLGVILVKALPHLWEGATILFFWLFIFAVISGLIWLFISFPKETSIFLSVLIVVSFVGAVSQAIYLRLIKVFAANGVILFASVFPVTSILFSVFLYIQIAEIEDYFMAIMVFNFFVLLITIVNFGPIVIKKLAEEQKAKTSLNVSSETRPKDF